MENDSEFLVGGEVGGGGGGMKNVTGNKKGNLFCESSDRQFRNSRLRSLSLALVLVSKSSFLLRPPMPEPPPPPTSPPPSVFRVTCENFRAV